MVEAGGSFRLYTRAAYGYGNQGLAEAYAAGF